MLLINPDLVPVVGILAFVGALTVGARVVMRPVIDAFLRARELKMGGADPARLDAQDRRIGELEGELAAVKQELERLSAVETFYAQLQGGRPPATPELPPGAGGAAS